MSTVIDGFHTLGMELKLYCLVGKDLDEDRHRPFADYRKDQDTMDMKRVYSSGHSNSVWACHDTHIVRRSSLAFSVSGLGFSN